MASPTHNSSFVAQSSDTILDTSLDADPDIDMNIAPGADAEGGNLDFGADGVREEDFGMGGAGDGNGIGQEVGSAEVRLPMRKDISLREFLGRMDEYAPIIPDAVTAHALTLAGLPPPPPSSTNPTSTTASTPHTPLHLSRLLALATQKFIADIAADAYQYSRMRSGNVTSNSLNAQGGVPGAPGAPAVGGGVAPGGAVGGGAAGAGAANVGGGGAGAGPGKGDKAGTGAHVLGMQRPGFGGGGQGGGQGRTVLTMEDLGMAVGEYGVNVRRGEFYR
ncbi:hypothetical protein MMC13_001939 [Lambiella insularis]|nr:hypothetical protein [Lambiella insularis]